MSSTQSVPFLSMFTKLIVDDEEQMVSYYREVYKLNSVVQVSGIVEGLGEPFSETILTPNDDSNQQLVIFRFIDRPAPRDQQVILGFITDDIDALAKRIVENGGKLCGEPSDIPEHGVRVLFSEDPEGTLCENVQSIAI